MINRARDSVTGGRHGWPVGAALALLFGTPVLAQMGPVETRGYVEYRYNISAGSESETSDAHGAAIRTDVSTYFWRPWILNARGSLLISEYASEQQGGLAKSSLLQGGLWLNAFSSSKFPLTLYYEDMDADYDSQPYRRMARTRSYGVRQQLMTDDYGVYAFEWRKGNTDAIYADGFSLPTRNDNEKIEFGARKSFGRHNFSLRSQKLTVDGDAPRLGTDSLRHTLRHSLNAGIRFDIQNTYFVTDEEIDGEFVQSDRLYEQLYSIATWRPNTERRMLVTGRGLFQQSESADQFNGSSRTSAALSGTASYELTERVSLTGSLGYSQVRNGISADAYYQELGLSYTSMDHEFWGGEYRYSGRTSFANRTGEAMLGMQEIQDLRFDVGHSFGRNFETGGGRRVDLRATQRLATRHDTIGRETNILRTSLYATTGSYTGPSSRYLRFMLTDQHTFGDEGRVFQLADLQYSQQITVSRDAGWDVNASMQYGRRSQTKPLQLSDESSSLSYSVSVAYRHSNLFDVMQLNYTSDFRFQSEDFESEDPFDPDFNIDRQRFDAAWRNRLDYRIGLLYLQADADLNEIDGHWFAAFRLNVRRFFGMR